MRVPETGAAPVAETPQSETPSAAQPEASPAPSETVPSAGANPPPAAEAESAAKPDSEAVPSTPSPDLVHGQQIYRQACAFCHDKGVAGAPKIGDVAAWNPRLAQGRDVLYVAALRGKGAMPAKGGNPSLSDADVIAAVDYLVAKSR